MADKKLGEVRTQFVEKVNKAIIRTVLDDLLEKRVVNDEEVEKVKMESVTQEQARILIDGIRKKGHKASLIAIKSIHARDAFLAEQLGLTAFLEGSPSQPLQALGPRAILSVEETQPVESRQGIKLCPPNVFDKIQKEESTKIYPIIPDLTRRTRLALVICNIDFESACFSRRDGAEVDKAGMERLLTGLGYKVESHTNLCSEEMADRLRKFAARKEHESSDSTFVVLMSHGLRAGLCGVKSQGENSDILSHDTIYSILNNKNCPALRNKPKVIIIQACRGENKGIIYESCADTPSADSLSPAPELPEKYESDAVRRVHLESDLICFCSTTPDNVSWRSPQTGSIFIVQLIKHMQEHAWCYHLEDIFREVQHTFNNNQPQMPTRERTTLLKKFYLFPGH